jgi:hypothetical protein
MNGLPAPLCWLVTGFSVKQSKRRFSSPIYNLGYKRRASQHIGGTTPMRAKQTKCCCPPHFFPGTQAHSASQHINGLTLMQAEQHKLREVRLAKQRKPS